jgi:hypothetical protein
MAAYVLFNRVTIRRSDTATAPQPILFVGLHRNGALDGVPYLQAAPEATYLISAQLHRSALMRALMPGIAVARRKDRDRGIQADNTDWLDACTEVLAAGGSLFVLPEGTSTLGPRHLPFKPGAAQIAAAAVTRGASVRLVPLAIHYERAWSWQSRVEIVIGAAIQLEAAGANPPAAAMQTISDSLEATGVNVDSEQILRAVEALAFAGTLGTDHSYAQNLKRLERNIPTELRTNLEEVWNTARWSGAWLFQELPLVPTHSLLRELLELLLLFPLVAAMLALNAPVCLLASWASRRLPDDLNVVAFWRAAVGLPAGIIWALFLIVGSSLKFSPWFALCYLLLSAVGVKAVRPLKTRAVAVHNALLAARIEPPMRKLMRSVAEYLAHA